jgi:hypothetical protein
MTRGEKEKARKAVHTDIPIELTTNPPKIDLIINGMRSQKEKMRPGEFVCFII